MSRDTRSYKEGHNGEPGRVPPNRVNDRSGDDGGRGSRSRGWICSVCNANNHASRRACHQCEQQRELLSTVRYTSETCTWMVEALQKSQAQQVTIQAQQEMSRAQQKTIQDQQGTIQKQQEELQNLKRKIDDLERENTDLTQERDDLTQKHGDLKQSISAVVYKGDTFIFTDQRQPMKQGGCGEVRRGKHVYHDYGEEKPKTYVVNGVRLLHYRQPTTWHRHEEVVIKTPTTLELFEREKTTIEILMQNKVQGVPKSCCYVDEKVIVMKDCGKTLWTIHRSERSERSEPVSLDVVCKDGLQLVNIVEQLHKFNVLHNDIKVENVTKTNNGTINLIDFGESILLKDGIHETDKLWSGLHRSLNHHFCPRGEKRKLSGVDDLWSVYFVLLDLVHPEIVEGWRLQRERARARAQNSRDYRKVVAQVKKEFVEGNDKCAILQVLKNDEDYATKLAKFKAFLRHHEEGQWEIFVA